MKKIINMALVSAIIASNLFVGNTLAENTTPKLIDYQGAIFDSAGNPVNKDLTFRFSFWDNADYTVADKNEDGSLNESASGYSGYYEIQEIKPNENGTFSTQIGAYAPLPAIDFQKMKYLQVEIKPRGSLPVNYELLDIDGGDDTVDRKALTMTPFAGNADTVDGKDVGYDAGQLPYLDENAKLPTYLLPENAEIVLSAVDIKLDNANFVAKNVEGALMGLKKLIDGLTLNLEEKTNAQELRIKDLEMRTYTDTDDQTASEVEFINDDFTAKNVADALIGLRKLIDGLTLNNDTKNNEQDGKIANLEQNLDATGVKIENDYLNAENVNDAFEELNGKLGQLADRVSDLEAENASLKARMDECKCGSSDDDDDDTFGQSDPRLTSMAGSIMFGNSNVRNLDDFERIGESVEGDIYTPNLQIKNQSFLNGFPGIDDRFEWFRVDYNGRFSVDEDAEYTFYLASDDGSKLFINGELVVDNDGFHSFRERSGKITLEKGKPYEIEVQYFQGPRTRIGLILDYKAGNGERKPFETNLIR